jgi:hypothetical protein
MNRRQLLKVALAGVATLAVPALPISAVTPKRSLPPGFQRQIASMRAKGQTSGMLFYRTPRQQWSRSEWPVEIVHDQAFQALSPEARQQIQERMQKSADHAERLLADGKPNVVLVIDSTVWVEGGGMPDDLIYVGDPVARKSFKDIQEFLEPRVLEEYATLPGDPYDNDPNLFPLMFKQATPTRP